MRGNQKLFCAVAVVAVTVVLLFSAPTTARAFTTNLNEGETINLGTVVTNGWSVEVGDKIFSDFAFSYNDFGAPDLDLVASNVTLRALTGNVGFGLEFQEPLSALNTKTKDINFQYTAMVDPSTNNLISGIYLNITGSHSGAGTGVVNEVAYSDTFGGTQVAQVGAWLGGTQENSNFLATALSKVWVSKDVEVSGASGGPTSSASISKIDQRFIQIPEPSTLLLVGLGLLGVVAVNRKRGS